MKKIMIAAAVLAALTACNKTLIESPVADSEYGYINFGLSSDLEIVDTKASATVTKNNSTYNVYLKQGTTDKWTSGDKNYKEYGDIAENDLKVPAGTYVIEAENYTETEAEAANNGYGDVRVKGSSQSFNVVAGASTAKVTVSCVPVNAKVTVAFADGFTDVFNTPTITLIDGSRNLAMTPATAAAVTSDQTTTYNHTVEVGTSVAYFNVDNGALSWKIEAIVGESKKTYSSTFTVEANKWNKITFKAGKNGNIVFDLSADTVITDSIEITPEIDPLNPQN